MHDMVKTRPRRPRNAFLRRSRTSRRTAPTLFLLLTALLLLSACDAAADAPAAETRQSHDTSSASADDLFSALLREHVHGGRVDYARMKDDPRLVQVCDSLARVQPLEFVDSNSVKSYWINVYNAFTLKLICDNYPVESINDLHFLGSLYISVPLGLSVWDSYEFLIDGREHTLNMVEHEILRARYADFRIHAAVVCASVSCPPLRSEAYDASRLDSQLDENMRAWCADTSKNRYDKNEGVLYLSKIFDWYESDFGASREAMVRAVLPYFPTPARNAVAAHNGLPDVEFLDYDWSLNE